MAHNCPVFNPHKFKPNICCDCFQSKECHRNEMILDERPLSCKPTISNNEVHVVNNNEVSDKDPINEDAPFSSQDCLEDLESLSQNHSSCNYDEQAVEKRSSQESSDPTVHSRIGCGDNKIAVNSVEEQYLMSSKEKKEVGVLIPCRYGSSCYRKNPNHFRRYSHTVDQEAVAFSENAISNVNQKLFPSPSSDSDRKNKCSSRLAKKKRNRNSSEIDFIEVVGKGVLQLIEDLSLREEEVVKLRQEIAKSAVYNQQLEVALNMEIDQRERREEERKFMLSIPRQTPSYWGPNSLEMSYREIPITADSSEFEIVKDLMNSTIQGHDNRFGTVNGQDPTEFLINRIVRIYNNDLWHVYCFTKDKIIQRTEGKLDTCASSTYLQKHPLLTPLLDKKTNEYWLFHGCSMTSLNQLLHDGYDPRVSNLKGMFGGGFYLAENSSKSNQYIPCPQCQQNCISTTERCNCPNQENLEFAMVLFRATLGDTHIVLKYDREKYRVGSNKIRVRRPPEKPGSDTLYDSVMGESMAHGGDKLKYREFILYSQGQAYPEYVIYFRRSGTGENQPHDFVSFRKNLQKLFYIYRSKPE